MSTEERLKMLREAEPGSWLALSSDESHLVASAKTLDEVLDRAEMAGHSDPLIVKAPTTLAPLVLTI
jgi:hypothetical protein